jgi:hypothetical protein
MCEEIRFKQVLTAEDLEAHIDTGIEQLTNQTQL